MLGVPHHSTTESLITHWVSPYFLGYILWDYQKQMMDGNLLTCTRLTCTTVWIKNCSRSTICFLVNLQSLFVSFPICFLKTAFWLIFISQSPIFNVGWSKFLHRLFTEAPVTPH